MGCKTCAGRLEELMRLEGRLTEQKKLTKLFQEGLERSQAKPTVAELLSIASTSAQIAKLSAQGFPEGDSVADEASKVALTSLKQVRERLEEGAGDGR